MDNGPLRLLSDPANAEFVASMKQGWVLPVHSGIRTSHALGRRVPDEMRVGDADVDVRLENKLQEDYVAPAYVAYSGSGHSAG